ncbi:MAG: PIG-L family deacetylase [Opitutales bacterium]|nr:PIG-L family deacetylase [Opitutales bacterium]MCH8541101.1 PIG-L family deacetylase [Opitutales bacterium]
MENSFRQYVAGLEKSWAEAKGWGPPEFSLEGKEAKPTANGPLAVILAPHPDDECIIGLWPLRLAREAGWQICVLPMSWGSKKERRAARREELEHAVSFLGWRVAPSAGSDHWEEEALLEWLRIHRPAAIFTPHRADGHPQHRRVREKLSCALQQMPVDFRCALIETEYWHPMTDPNLLVQGSAAQVGDLVAALSCHVGEVSRNPYHLTLPAWMMDTVRRGAELLGGQGAPVPDFCFGTLYRLSFWKNRELAKTSPAKPFLTANANPARDLGDG